MYNNLQNLDRQILSLLIFACFYWIRVEILYCTQLHSDNFNAYTPTHTNMSWHTYWLLCKKWAYVCWNAHVKPLWTFPSNVYASTKLKTRWTAMWDRLKTSAFVAWVGNTQIAANFSFLTLQAVVDIAGMLYTVCRIMHMCERVLVCLCADLHVR